MSNSRRPPSLAELLSGRFRASRVPSSVVTPAAIAAASLPPPRLPVQPLPAAPVENAPRVLPVEALGDERDFEAKTLEIEVAATFGSRPVLELDRPWRACDVYVSVDDVMGGGSWIRARIFANVTEQRPVQVARGFFRSRLRDLGAPDPTWVAAARVAGGSSFSADFDFQTVAFAGTKVRLTIVGSNDVTPAPSWVGVEPAALDGIDGPIDRLLSSMASSNPCEVVSINAITTAAAGTRWLHLFDSAGVIANGTSPDLAWPIPVEGLDLRPGYLCRRGLQLIASSTANTLTAVAGGGGGDTFVQAMVR